MIQNNDIINPLLAPLTTPWQTPAFDKYRHEDYLPAFKEALALARAEIEAISANPPSFANTIEALSFSGRLLGSISQIFFNLNHAETDDRLQQIAREVSPLLSDFNSDVLFHEGIFAKVRAVYDERTSITLTPEQSMLLEKTWKSFARNGALLPAQQKQQLREIKKELSELSLRFNDNLLAETHNWFLHVTDSHDVLGLPQSSLEGAELAAKEKNLQGWVFTLEAPSFIPFMRYADNRALREKMYKAYATRCYKGDTYDNTEVLLRIAHLRLEKARLLGYKHHAAFVLEETMAASPERVKRFLDDLAMAALPRAKQEYAQLQAFAKEMGFEDAVKPWDWAYWAEKLRNKLFDYDEELTRPYFSLAKVVDGVFALTQRLWGLTYTPNPQIPVYHPDVTAYEVYDGDGTMLAVLYLDFFPRKGKSGGAWMTQFRDQYCLDDENVRPHVSLVCNFSKPTDTKPSLLTFNEVTTFLHEFGHALHGIFSQVTYPDLSGTHVFRDFVELPSQILENWAVEKAFLDLFAYHYQTGEAMPEALIEKIISSRNFHAAYACVRQLSFGLNDMAWHTIIEPVSCSAEDFEKQAMEPVALFDRIEGTLMSAGFSHIFGGGYAAGYYGYKWAEVLDADAFKLFKENGVFDTQTAHRFRELILSKGGSEHPMDLYVRFRGKEPSVDALLEREGLAANAS